MGKKKRKRCTCTVGYLCKSMRPTNDNRVEFLIPDPECPLHRGADTPTETKPC